MSGRISLAFRSAATRASGYWRSLVHRCAGVAAAIALTSCQSSQEVLEAGAILGADLDHIFGAVGACFIEGSDGLTAINAACTSAPRPETGAAPTVVFEPRPLQHVARFPDALPREDQSAISLIDRKPTRLVYQATENAAPAPGALTAPVAPRAAAALAAGGLFEVAFYCGVCSPEDNAQPRAEIALSASRAETNSIEFFFTPDSRLSYPLALPTGAKAGAAIITLVLYKDGVRHDQISIPLELLTHRAAMSRVNLMLDQLKLLAASQPIGEPALARSDTRKNYSTAFSQASDSAPDITLVMDFAPTAGGARQFRIEATIHLPIDPIERTQFQNQFRARDFAIGSDPLKIAFMTRFTTFNEIDALLQSTYEALSCLTIGSNSETAAFRAELRSRHEDRCLQDPVLTRAVWTDTNVDATRAAVTLYNEGRRLFGRLFGDPQTSELARFLIAARAISEDRAAGRLPGRPLKLRYQAQEYHIPLQLAHPPVENFDRKSPQFFGLAFNIVAGKGAAGDSRQPFVQPLSQREVFDVAFAGYALNPATTFDQTSNCDPAILADSVALQSCQHYKALAGSLRTSGRGVSLSAPMFESAKLTAELRLRARRLSLVWAYAHGMTRFDSNQRTVAPRSFQDARLLLSKGTSPFFPSLIDSAVAGIEDAEVFKSHPLVVLLACETGIAGSGGTSGLSFPQAFINAGAIGVVATESEVNGPTASVFGDALLEYLYRDHSPSEAVLFARRKVFIDGTGNLWPLLFHYTGSQGRFREN